MEGWPGPFKLSVEFSDGLKTHVLCVLGEGGETMLGIPVKQQPLNDGGSITSIQRIYSPIAALGIHQSARLSARFLPGDAQKHKDR
ncbi:MAG: hypothetical protein ACI8UO_005825 [Verrucomicrobiales bacterium]|jgi:hypothetical protein